MTRFACGIYASSLANEFQCTGERNNVQNEIETSFLGGNKVRFLVVASDRHKLSEPNLVVSF